jgi:flavodoxin
MPKILVIYDSRSGNTEKMALAVAKGAEIVGDITVTMKRAEQTKSSLSKVYCFTGNLTLSTLN